MTTEDQPFAYAIFDLNGRRYVCPIRWAVPTVAEIVEPLQDRAIAAGLSVAGEGWYDVDGTVFSLPSKEQLRGVER